MKKFVAELLNNNLVRGYNGSVSMSEDDIMTVYRNLRDRYSNDIEVGNFVLVKDEDLDRYVNHLLSKADIDALSNVLKTYAVIKTGTVDSKEVNKEYFKNLFVKYTHIGAYVTVRKYIQSLPSGAQVNYSIRLKEFQDFITQSEGWNHKFCDSVSDEVNYVSEPKPLIGFAQFINYSIIELFKSIDGLEDLMDVEDKINVIKDMSFGDMFAEFQGHVTEEKIKELFA